MNSSENNESLNQEIMDMIKARLAKGQRTYNTDVMLNDHRDFIIETLEEVLDSMVYTAGQLLRIYKGYSITPK